MKKIKGKKEKAITLISLVITIVILLILAGITIVSLQGENGLFTRTKQAKQAQLEAEMKEKLTLAIQELQVEKLGEVTIDDITQEWIDKEIKDYNCTVNDDLANKSKKVGMEKSGTIHEFLIDEKLNITGTGENYPKIEIQTTTPIVNEDANATSSVEANTKTRGTTLYINFEATLEGANCTIEPTVPYAVISNGKYKFTATGTYQNKTITKEIEVTVDQYQSAQGVVQYDAGDWTEEEINSLKNSKLYDLNARYTKNSTFKLNADSGLNFTFGGFTYKGDTANESNISSGAVITSRNQSVSPESGEGTPKYDGWQVLESTEENEKTYVTKLVHAGTPENFVYRYTVTNDAYRAEYLLSNGERQTGCSSLSNGTAINPRSWDMYKDKELDAKGYIKEVHAMTYSEANSASSSIRTTGSRYWLGSAYDNSYVWHVNGSGNMNGSRGCYCWGVRPVVSLESGVYIASGEGTASSPYILAKE